MDISSGKRCASFFSFFFSSNKILSKSMILFLCFRWMAHHLIEKFDNVVEGLIMVPVVGRCLW